MMGAGAMLLKICFFKNSGDWLSPVMCLFHPLHWQATYFRHGYPGKQDSSSPIGPFLNAGFVQVNFHRQWPRLLALLWLFYGDSDHRTQVIRVYFVGIIQKLFISIDAQLKRHKEEMSENSDKTSHKFTLTFTLT